MAQIPLTLSQMSNGFGSIATIAKPETITSIAELPDVKVMVKETGGPYKQLYFQLNIRLSNKDASNPRGTAERLNKAIWQETRSKRFRLVHGDCVAAINKDSPDPRANRLVDSLERLVKHAATIPRIMAYPGTKERLHEFSLKLPRGVHFRMFHSLIASRLAPPGRQHEGVFALGENRYYYYLWRPAAIHHSDIPHDVLCHDVMAAFKECFPFIDVSQAKMLPNIDLLKARELELIARQNNQSLGGHYIHDLDEE